MGSVAGRQQVKEGVQTELDTLLFVFIFACIRCYKFRQNTLSKKSCPLRKIESPLLITRFSLFPAKWINKPSHAAKVLENS